MDLLTKETLLTHSAPNNVTGTLFKWRQELNFAKWKQRYCCTVPLKAKKNRHAANNLNST